MLLPASGVFVERISSKFRRFQDVVLPTSGVFMERSASKFRRFGGTYCIQIQAFWWNVLHPNSGILVERTASNFNFFPPEDEGRTFLLNIGTLLPDCTAPYVIRRDIYSQRHENLEHVTGVKVCNSEFCFTSKSIFSIEAQYETSIVLRGL